MVLNDAGYFDWTLFFYEDEGDMWLTYTYIVMFSCLPKNLEGGSGHWIRSICMLISALYQHAIVAYTVDILKCIQ